ncbi:MAG: carbohydrate ABC transporter substrate-binding protein [Clostridiaceae bacterium]|nr:carbohydrate ABC transporter substrate-binding protein [Clostridiaceae bacterium]
MSYTKRFLAIAIIVAIALSVVGCTKAPEASIETDKPQATNNATPKASPETTTSEGNVLRIYCWNEEFKSRFTDYFEKAGKLPDGIEVQWVITPNENNAYQNKLDEDLLKQDTASEKIDIFLIEADYALKYVDTDYTLDVINDIGLTEADLAEQYEYTKEIATDSNGRLKGVTWQATPGLFAYRRSIAKEVLGTDDPTEVQKHLSDWDKFDSVAAKMHSKGYKMLSGYDDAYRTFSNNVSAPWVDSNDKIVIDPNLMRWVDQTKTYTDKGYNNKTSLWSAEWAADQGPEGKVFGFFYSTWGINFTLLDNSLAVPVAEGGKKEVGNGIFGDWAVCEGPQSYYWGGTWICAAKGTDNISLVRDVMKTLTCDANTMKQITLDTEDYTNNKKAMNELANSDYQSAFLGGQNHIALFAAAAPKIDMSNISKYDQGMNEEFQAAFKDYFDGTVTKDQALENFYNAVTEKYPNLSR